ncbi:unnamed protein product [Polarella glacialis]|uniref:Uncharacterized protein n=1 Tax=Polarella glacialis TaxID=89957 RepID=A0A813D1Y8_POLGL|nr:unnamed protein product [Polarella glacialis]
METDLQFSLRSAWARAASTSLLLLLLLSLLLLLLLLLLSLLLLLLLLLLFSLIITLHPTSLGPESRGFILDFRISCTQLYTGYTLRALFWISGAHFRTGVNVFVCLFFCC